MVFQTQPYQIRYNLQIFLISDEEMCHCYSDLHPFHCEEEEGADLVQIKCIVQKKVANNRPLLTMLSRASATMATTKRTVPKNNIKFGAKQKTTLAAAAGVLILMAIFGLVCLMGKTCHEEKRKKKNSVMSTNSASSQASSTASSTATLTRL